MNMTSTFHGLETAKRALFAQQSGLYTTGHNIANANTPGYTRQRVNFAATEGYPPASVNRSIIPGHIGTGVTAGTVQRIRDAYLDVQYRAENAKVGYYATNAKAMAQLEDILNETGKDPSGLSRVINDYWQALQELSTNPENDGVRTVVLERGNAVADAFNHLHHTIEFYRKDLGNQLDGSVDRINALLKEIHQINQQIAKVEPHGYLPNDLYDERDRLVDELSEYLDITVDAVKSSENGSANPLAEGIYVIRVNGIEIVGNGGPLELKLAKSADGYVTGLSFGGQPLEIQALPAGKVKSLIENYGYDNGKGTYPELLAKLDALAVKFIQDVNDVHKHIRNDQGDIVEVITDVDLFAGDGAHNIRGALTDISRLVPSLTGSGDGTNARRIGDALKGVMNDYEALIGDLGIKAQSANRRWASAETLRSAAEDKRLSVSTVSLDEEMMNMIKFQHAYNAAARTITIIDEMLDKIVNGMGVGGR
jgi:flagellar hook-associated protein 1 FlgK